MEIDFFSVLVSVLSLVVLIIPGFLLVKLKVLNQSADKIVSGIVLYVCQPMLMIMSLQKQLDKSFIKNILIVAGLAIVLHAIIIALMYLVVRSKSKDVKLNCVRFASCFANVGYMGIPFLQTLFKDNLAVQGEILIYCAIIIAVFNLITWSIGVYMISGDKKDINIKKAFLNPTSIAVYIGLAYFLVVGKPIATLGAVGSNLNLFLSKMMGSMQFLADMVTPLSMMVIGIKLASMNVKELFVEKWAYVTSVFKLIVFPLITILVVAFLPVSQIVKYVLFFTLAMPSASNTVLFSVSFGGDGKVASIFVLLSTILSVVTIPLMFLVINGVFGI